MHEWILRNSPRDIVNWSPHQHWQRVQTAFQAYPALRDLCRTPVFLRMLSEVLVKDRSVKSLYDLVERFCIEMWERERGKRTLTLSDEQYFYAYEAMSVMMADEERISPSDVKVTLELHLEEYAPELLASLPEDAGTLVADLSIGPLTYHNGVFVFIHEVLHAYFLSRLLARGLSTRKRIATLWNRQINDTVWKFLPGVVQEVIPTALPPEKFISEIAGQTMSGLVMWNVSKALGLSPARVPKILFEGKSIGSVICEGADMSGVSFDRSTIHDVTFDRCTLLGATFRGARIRKLKFIECGPGAQFDQEPLVDDASEVTVMRASSGGPEVYVGTDTCKLFEEFRGQATPRAELPRDLAEQALVVIFASLFKADRRRPDYPERYKIQNRLRAWLRSFQLAPQESQALLDVLSGAIEQLIRGGWICLNTNRPRTLLPCAAHQREVAQILRTGKIETQMPGLGTVSSRLQDARNEVIASA